MDYGIIDLYLWVIVFRQIYWYWFLYIDTKLNYVDYFMHACFYLCLKHFYVFVYIYCIDICIFTILHCTLLPLIKILIYCLCIDIYIFTILQCILEHCLYLEVILSSFIAQLFIISVFKLDRYWELYRSTVI